MRTLVDLPDDDVRWLDVRAKANGTSRAALVREAISTYRDTRSAEEPKGWLKAGFGLWKDRTDIGDGVEYQRALRAEWDREWDEPVGPAPE